MDPQKDHYEPKKTLSAFNNNYIQYQGMGDTGKNLSIKEYFDVIRPYLTDIINNYKISGDGKFIQAIKTRTMHAKSDNLEIMMGSETDETIEELLKSLLQGYQE